LRIGQDEGNTVPKRLETLADQEVKMNTIHKIQMRGDYHLFQGIRSELERDDDESCKIKRVYWLNMIFLNSRDRRRG